MPRSSSGFYLQAFVRRLRELLHGHFGGRRYGREFFSLHQHYGTHLPCRFFDLAALTIIMSYEGYEHRGCWPYPKTYASGVCPTIAVNDDSSIDLRLPLTVPFERK